MSTTQKLLDDLNALRRTVLLHGESANRLGKILSSESSSQRNGTVGCWKGKFKSVSGPVYLNEVWLSSLGTEKLEDLSVSVETTFTLLPKCSIKSCHTVGRKVLHKVRNCFSLIWPEGKRNVSILVTAS